LQRFVIKRYQYSGLSETRRDLQNLEVRVKQEEDDESSEQESDSDPWNSENTSGLESELESTSAFEDSKLESTSAFGDGELENLSDIYDSLFTHYESTQFLPQPTWDLTNFQFQILRDVQCINHLL
jgi:hypothetical protein